MKVLHASKFYPPYHGGMETIVGDLCDGTARDWDVQVAVANDRAQTTRERRHGVNVVRAASYGSAAPLLLFVGRLVYYKGVHILIEAASRWPGSIAIVGEGPLEAELRADVARRGLQERVVFAGRVSDDDLPAYYQACDAFVLPSIARTEAFGVVQIEAMAAGRPVISTNLPTGVPWVNRDGVSGLVVAPDNADALGAALAELGEDEALRGRHFQVLKFRSMIADAERGVGPLQASTHDPRITRVGRILRATAMDELPQLWNIFRGDMSFVGPRALRPEEIDVDGAGASIAL